MIGSRVADPPSGAPSPIALSPIALSPVVWREADSESRRVRWAATVFLGLAFAAAAFLLAATQVIASSTLETRIFSGLLVDAGLGAVARERLRVHLEAHLLVGEQVEAAAGQPLAVAPPVGTGAVREALRRAIAGALDAPTVHGLLTHAHRTWASGADSPARISLAGAHSRLRRAMLELGMQTVARCQESPNDRAACAAAVGLPATYGAYRAAVDRAMATLPPRLGLADLWATTDAARPSNTWSSVWTRFEAAATLRWAALGVLLLLLIITVLVHRGRPCPSLIALGVLLAAGGCAVMGAATDPAQARLGRLANGTLGVDVTASVRAIPGRSVVRSAASGAVERGARRASPIGFLALLLGVACVAGGVELLERRARGRGRRPGDRAAAVDRGRTGPA